MSVCRHFAVCHIVLWNCCCCVLPQWREGGEQRGELHYSQRAFLCNVLTERESLHLHKQGEWEAERRVRKRMNNSAVSAEALGFKALSLLETGAISKNPIRTPSLLFLPSRSLFLFVFLALLGMSLLFSHILCCSEFTSSRMLSWCQTHWSRPSRCTKTLNCDETADWDEMTPKDKHRWNKRRQKKSACEKGKWKEEGRRQVKGNEDARRVVHCVLVLRAVSVWHCVWHLTVMRLPVSCCVGNVPVSFHFCGDSCLSCVGILVVSDRKWKTEVC